VSLDIAKNRLACEEGFFGNVGRSSDATGGDHRFLHRSRLSSK
jgi:hypothetical protein